MHSPSDGSRLNIDAQATANRLQQANQTLISTNGNAAQSFNQAVAAINQINLNDKMDAAHKTQAVAEVWHTVQSQLKVIGAVAGLNLTGALALANSPGFDANGNWIGFPADASTSATNTPAPNSPAASPVV